MSSKIATIPSEQTLPEDIARVLMDGDLSKLGPAQRVLYYNKTCESLGLNPLTKPFDYIRLNGRLTLYARKDCTEQLRQIHKVSITIADRSMTDGVYVVTARASTPDGRHDESVGAVDLGHLKGDAKANAIMKAETKAKRRVTLSICGLGMLDESETDSIPTAERINPDVVQGEVLPPGSDLETVDDYLARIRGFTTVFEAQKWEDKHAEEINDRFDQDDIERIGDALYARKEELQSQEDQAPQPDLNLWAGVLKRYRREQDLSPEDLAAQMHVRVETLKKIFSGKKVSAQSLDKVSAFIVRIQKEAVDG